MAWQGGLPGLKHFSLFSTRWSLKDESHLIPKKATEFRARNYEPPLKKN